MKKGGSTRVENKSGSIISKSTERKKSSTKDSKSSKKKKGDKSLGNTKSKVKLELKDLFLKTF